MTALLAALLILALGGVVMTAQAIARVSGSNDRRLVHRGLALLMAWIFVVVGLVWELGLHS